MMSVLTVMPVLPAISDICVKVMLVFPVMPAVSTVMLAFAVIAVLIVMPSSVYINSRVYSDVYVSTDSSFDSR